MGKTMPMSHLGVTMGTNPWAQSKATPETMPMTLPRVSMIGPPLFPL